MRAHTYDSPRRGGRISPLLLILLAAFAALTSCQKDDDGGGADLERCGNGRRFYLDAEGDCTVCATDRGLYRMGRDGQFCYRPGEYAEQGKVVRMMTFGPAPKPGIVADTFIWTLDTIRINEDSLRVYGSGNMFLGAAARWREEEDNWRTSDCRTRVPATTLIENNPGFFQFRSSDDDPTMSEDGGRVSFLIGNLDVNGDCWEDYGFANGRVVGDTVRMIVHWRSYDNLPNPSGDTVVTDSAYLFAVPWE